MIRAYIEGAPDMIDGTAVEVLRAYGEYLGHVVVQVWYETAVPVDDHTAETTRYPGCPFRVRRQHLWLIGCTNEMFDQDLMEALTP